MKHHEFSPSKLERIENCPSSWKVCKNWQGKENADSDRGNILHEAFYNDEVFKTLSGADADMIGKLREEYVNRYIGNGFKHYNEMFVEIRKENGELLTSGTVDYFILSPNEEIGSMIDLKFGNYEVTEAAENIQVFSYVAGLFQKFPKLKKVYALIVQPVYGVGEYSKQAEFTRENVKGILNRIETIQRKAKDADLEDESCYGCSPSNCRYCNKAGCFVYRNKMEQNFQLLSVDGAELSLHEKEMTIEYADRMLVAAKEIIEIVKSKTELAKSVILKNGGSENYRIQKGKTTAKTDWESIARKFEVTPEMIDEHTTVTIGEPYPVIRTRKKQNRTAIESSENA